jgi:hypothetical protein
MPLGVNRISMGRTIGLWMRKAFDSFKEGATVVCLVPARTDTNWWHDYAMKGEIEFIKGRLKFGGHKNSAPFPSAVVAFDDRVRMWKHNYWDARQASQSK